MKIAVEIDTNEPTDLNEFSGLAQYRSVCRVLLEMRNHFRNTRKHENDSKYEAAEELLYELVNEYNIDMDLL